MKIKDIRKLMISKRLNLLLGSGCSSESIPLMGYYQKKYPNLNLANDKLEDKIKSVSQVLSSHDYSKIKRPKSIDDTLRIYVAFIQKSLKY